MILAYKIIYVGLGIAVKGKDYAGLYLACCFYFHVYFTIGAVKSYGIAVLKAKTCRVSAVQFTERVGAQTPEPRNLMSTRMYGVGHASAGAEVEWIIMRCIWVILIGKRI